MVEFFNPPQNYITHVMLQELYTQLLEDQENDSVRVLVLTGGVEGTFLTHYSVEELLKYRRATARKLSGSTTLRGPYYTSKIAVRGFTLTLAQELRNTTVNVTCVFPGGVKTNIVRNERFHKAPRSI